MHRKFEMAREAEFILVTVPKEVLFTVLTWRLLASTVLSILMTFFAKQPTLIKESKLKIKSQTIRREIKDNRRINQY